jgi:hypothetical protein
VKGGGHKRVKAKIEEDEWWAHLQPALENYLKRAARPVCTYVDREGRLFFEACKRADEKEGLPSKPRRIHPSVFSPEDFRDSYESLIGLGGKLCYVTVNFGTGPGDTRMWFRPHPAGGMTVGWELRAWNDDLKAQLNRAGRRLWNHDLNCPSVEFQVVEEGTALLTRLRAIAKTLASDKAQEPPERMPTLTQVEWVLENLLDCCLEERGAKRLHIATSIYRSFEKDVSAPEPDRAIYESPDVRRIKKSALRLALKLQRPPTMWELRGDINWTRGNGGLKEFKGKLCDAGLGWLPKDRNSRKILSR